MTSTTGVPYTGATGTVNLGAQAIKTTYIPIAGADLTNKTYVDTQDALLVPYTGANKDINLGSNSMTAYNLNATYKMGVGTTTPSGALHVVGPVANFTDLTGLIANSNLILQNYGYNGNTKNSILMGTYFNSSVDANSYGVIQSNFGTTMTLPLILQPLGGNIGIGTSTPMAPFHVIGNTSISTYPANTIAVFQAANSVGVNDAGILLGSVNGNTPYISDYGSASLGLLFYTNKNERMRITSSGNVGIGTSSPGAKFHLDNGATSGLNSYFYASAITSGQNTSIAIGKSPNTSNSGTILWNHVGDGSASNYLGLGAYGGDNKLVVLASGNVGIGTTAPSTTFHVVGATTLNGDVTLPGLTAGTAAYAIGLTSANKLCIYTASGSGAFSGTTAAGYLPYASAANTFANSLLSQSGTTITNSGNEIIAGTLTVNPGSTTNLGGALKTQWTDIGVSVASAYALNIVNSGTWTSSTTFTKNTSSNAYFCLANNLQLGATYQLTFTATGNITVLPGSVDVVGDNWGTWLSLTATSQTYTSLVVTATYGKVYIYTQASASGGTITLSALSIKRLDTIVPGNLGIGTTAPSSALHVNGVLTAGAANFFNNNTAVSGGYVKIQPNGTNNNTGYVEFRINDGTTDTRHGYIGFASTSTKKLYLNAEAGNALSFGSGDGSERMTIASDGKVGIGTAAPPALLSVLQNSAAYSKQLVVIDAGAGGTSAPTGIGQPLMNIGYSSYKAAGDYYGIGFGYITSSFFYPPAEIGLLVGTTGGNTYGDLVFSTRSVYTNTVASERMRITNDGKVGIGTTAPGYLLTVGVSGVPGANTAGTTTLQNYGNLNLSRNRLIFSDSNNDWNHSIYNNYKNLDNEGIFDGMKFNVYNGAWFRVGNASLGVPTTAMYIASDGKVGIGTTAPNAPLHIVGSGGASSTTTLLIENSANSNTGYGAQIAFSNYSTSPMSLGSIACLRENNAGNWSSSMVLSPAVNGVTTERMRITSSGNVGIGTASPSANLQIYGNYDAAVNAYITNASRTVNAYSQIWLSNDSGGGGGLFLNSSARSVDGGANTMTVRNDKGILRLQGSGANGIAVNGGGSVGILNDNPAYTLDVNGSLNVTGYAYLRSVPQMDYQYGSRALCLDSAGRIAFGSSVCNWSARANSFNWGGGVNYTYAFYRNNSYVSTRIAGKFSYYATSVATQYPQIRIYSQSTGQYWYYAFNNFSNLTYCHTTFPFHVVFASDVTTATGWFDVYIYNGGGCSTDDNDQLYVNYTSHCGNGY